MNFLNVKEAAEKYSLSEKTLKDWLRAEKVKGEKIGRAWRIEENAIREYLKLGISENDEIIDDLYIQAELQRLQNVLLDVDEEYKEGIDKSMALSLVADLEGIIEKIEGHSFNRLERCQWERYNSGQMMTRKNAKISPEEQEEALEADMKWKIQTCIEKLITGSEDLYLSETVEFLQDAMSRQYKRIPPLLVRDLKELSNMVDNFQQKETEEITTMVDTYKVASFFRRIEEYIDNEESGNAKFTRNLPSSDNLKVTRKLSSSDNLKVTRKR